MELQRSAACLTTGVFMVPADSLVWVAALAVRRGDLTLSSDGVWQLWVDPQVFGSEGLYPLCLTGPNAGEIVRPPGGDSRLLGLADGFTWRAMVDIGGLVRDEASAVRAPLVLTDAGPVVRAIFGRAALLINLAGEDVTALAPEAEPPNFPEWRAHLVEANAAHRTLAELFAVAPDR